MTPSALSLWTRRIERDRKRHYPADPRKLNVSENPVGASSSDPSPFDEILQEGVSLKGRGGGLGSVGPDKSRCCGFFATLGHSQQVCVNV